MTESAILHYVVLRHDNIDEPHFDLLFETAPGSDLAAWRCTEWPVGKLAEFQHLRDHRRFYLTYEGPISGERGSVRRIHEGTHRVEANDEKQLLITLETGQTLRLRK